MYCETEVELTLLVLFTQLWRHFTPHSLQLRTPSWFIRKNKHYSLSHEQKLWWEVLVLESWKSFEGKGNHFHRELKTQVYCV